MIVQSIGHLVLMGLVSRSYVPGWFTGETWDFSLDGPMDQSAAHFWLVLGSFAVPQLLLGAVAVWLARRGITLPAFVGWGLGAWGLLCAVVIEPTPVITALAPAVLLIVAARRGSRLATSGA